MTNQQVFAQPQMDNHFGSSSRQPQFHRKTQLFNLLITVQTYYYRTSLRGLAIANQQYFDPMGSIVLTHVVLCGCAQKSRITCTINIMIAA